MSESPETSGESVQENPPAPKNPESALPHTPREIGAVVPAGARTVRNARARGRVIE